MSREEYIEHVSRMFGDPDNLDVRRQAGEYYDLNWGVNRAVNALFRYWRVEYHVS